LPDKNYTVSSTKKFIIDDGTLDPTINTFKVITLKNDLTQNLKYYLSQEANYYRIFLTTAVKVNSFERDLIEISPTPIEP
jgi:hypothetical protein